jgi:23S rRNA pseudouridine1911/1915/1917 synthase
VVVLKQQPLRIITVSREEAGRPVGWLLKTHLRLSWSQVRRLIEQNRVRQGQRLCRDAQIRVRAGQKLRVQLELKSAPSPSKPPVLKSHSARVPDSSDGRRQSAASQDGHSVVLRYVDDQIVVVDKPAGLTTMRHPHEAAEFGKRGKRFLPATLADLLPELLSSQGKGHGRVIAVHRLDRDTSGLVIFARSPNAAKHLGAQFRGHTTDRAYLALVRGKAKSERVESRLVADRGDGRRGSESASNAADGQRAVTQIHVVQTLGNYTLVECRLETGRTHQVRIHLGERGTPICGERIYDRPLNGKPLPDASGAERLALHAASLAIVHPTTGKPMRWTAALPLDMQRLLKKLRTKP